MTLYVSITKCSLLYNVVLYCVPEDVRVAVCKNDSDA